MNKKVILFLLVSIFIIGIIIYSILNKAVVPIVVGTNPDNGSVNILETSQIDITFDSKITNQTKSGITITISPEVGFDSTWLSNTYKIIPKNNLQNNTKYTAKVLYKNKSIYTFSFETIIFSQTQIQKDGVIQSQNDYVFGQATKKVVNQYPWYTSLPIKTQDYVVYYDFQKQKFAITFLAKNTADKQASLTQSAITNIKSIGVKDPVQYYVTNSATSTASPAP